MKAVIYALASLATILGSPSAFADGEPSSTYTCRELERNNRQTRAVRGGLQMIVSTFSQGEEEGEPFKVNIRVGNSSRGEVFAATIKGTQEDVVFHFAGIARNKGKIAGVIFLDELDQTSVRIHLKGGERIKAHFDCDVE